MPPTLSDDIRDRLRATGCDGFTIASLERQGDDRLRYALDSLDRAYRLGEAPEDPVEYLLELVATEWDGAQAAATQLTLADALVAASAPPEGTRWVRVAGARQLFEVVAIHGDRVETRDPRLQGALGRGIIPDRDWPACEWLEAPPDAP